MANNQIQFGVVREDPQIELDIISKFDVKTAVLVGSGGCTALSLKSRHPLLKLTLMEPNQAQVNLIKKKIRILKKHNLATSRKLLGTSKDNPVIESGNFESLFRVFRNFLHEFVISEKDLRRLMINDSKSGWQPVFENPYWEVAFDLCFSNSLLIAMFGPEAIQYASKNSYPKYFKSVFERGVVRKDIKHNYFLHHIFLGHYDSDIKSLPLYLQKKTHNFDLDYKTCLAHEYEDYQSRDLVSLSNIFDWSDPNMVRKIANLVSSSMSEGSVLVYRQLNNKKDFKALFKGFRWQTNMEKSALIADRSLFYSNIAIGVKHE